MCSLFDLGWLVLRGGLWFVNGLACVNSLVLCVLTMLIVLLLGGFLVVCLMGLLLACLRVVLFQVMFLSV